MDEKENIRRLRLALRQIYSAAQGLERGEEHIVDVAQEIQRICDGALRGWEPRNRYMPIPWAGDHP